MHPLIDALALGAANMAFRMRPHPIPAPADLDRARIIAHRGERDDRHVFENTFAAFDPLIGTGVWALETDVRWSADGIPMVFHDPDLKRLFGDHRSIAALPFDDLRRDFPMIPTLAEFSDRYASSFHLFIEIKATCDDAPIERARSLARALASAEFEHGYHLIGLAPWQLDALPGIGPSRTLGIARANINEISRDALRNARHGIGAPLALVRSAHLRAHHDAGQMVGVGFPDHPALLRREIGRGVPWLFCNRAAAMQRALDDMRAQAETSD